jgi:hypothetical protein
MKKTLLTLALIATLATMAMAAQKNVPASIGERIAVKSQPPVMQNWNVVHHDTAPGYCKPCLFYAGDFDSSNTGANGLWDGNSAGIQGDVWVPFSVKKAAHATGLFINILTSGTGAINNPTPYAIYKGITTGNAGTKVVAGTATATTAPTGRTGFSLVEYTVQITKIKKTAVKAKTVYFMNIEPQDSTGQLWYESDVEDVPPPNHVGAKDHNDDSFFNSSFFGFTYAPTWGSTGVCAGTGCDMFSVGVTGK